MPTTFETLRGSATDELPAAFGTHLRFRAQRLGPISLIRETHRREESREEFRQKIAVNGGNITVERGEIFGGGVRLWQSLGTGIAGLTEHGQRPGISTIAAFRHETAFMSHQTS